MITGTLCIDVVIEVKDDKAFKELSNLIINEIDKLSGVKGVQEVDHDLDYDTIEEE